MKTLVALVGTKFRGEEMMALLASLPQGEPLTLVREPGNKFDSNAVQVWARGHHIGYIKSSQNKAIALSMDAERGRTGVAISRSGKLAIDGGRQPMVEIGD